MKILGLITASLLFLVSCTTQPKVDTEPQSQRKIVAEPARKVNVEEETNKAMAFGGFGNVELTALHFKLQQALSEGEFPSYSDTKPQLGVTRDFISKSVAVDPNVYFIETSFRITTECGVSPGSYDNLPDNTILVSYTSAQPQIYGYIDLKYSGAIPSNQKYRIEVLARGRRIDGNTWSPYASRTFWSGACCATGTCY